MRLLGCGQLLKHAFPMASMLASTNLYMHFASITLATLPSQVHPEPSPTVCPPVHRPAVGWLYHSPPVGYCAAWGVYQRVAKHDRQVLPSNRLVHPRAVARLWHELLVIGGNRAVVCDDRFFLVHPATSHASLVACEKSPNANLVRCGSSTAFCCADVHGAMSHMRSN